MMKIPTARYLPGIASLRDESASDVIFALAYFFDRPKCNEISLVQYGDPVSHFEYDADLPVGAAGDDGLEAGRLGGVGQQRAVKVERVDMRGNLHAAIVPSAGGARHRRD